MGSYLNELIQTGLWGKEKGSKIWLLKGMWVGDEAVVD